MPFVRGGLGSTFVSMSVKTPTWFSSGCSNLSMAGIYSWWETKINSSTNGAVLWLETFRTLPVISQAAVHYILEQITAAQELSSASSRKSSPSTTVLPATCDPCDKKEKNPRS